jgi:hypothetical protein
MFGTLRLSFLLWVVGDVNVLSTAGFGHELRTMLMMENEDACDVIVANNKSVKKPPPHFNDIVGKMLMLLIDYLEDALRLAAPRPNKSLAMSI